MQTRRTKGWNWVKIGAIGEITAAFVTLLTLGYIVWQNIQMQTLINQSQTLIAGVQNLIEPASHAFLARADPLVVIQGYKWLHRSGTPPINCEHPPAGIVVIYQNVSGVPVAVEPKAKVELAMGQRVFVSTEAVEAYMDIVGEVILPPDGSNSVVLHGGPELQENYRRLRGFTTEPTLSFTLYLVYRSLVTGKRYEYTGKMTIFESCTNPTQTIAQRGPETRKELPYQ